MPSDRVRRHPEPPLADDGIGTAEEARTLWSVNVVFLEERKTKFELGDWGPSSFS